MDSNLTPAISADLDKMTMKENTAVATIGSDAWNGAEDYEGGDVLHERATAFFAAVKWDVLALLSSKLRHGIFCHFGEKFSVGHFNMVRRLDFADGISWVARLRLPPLTPVFGHGEQLDDASALKSELASMKFLKAKTSIAVPEVYGYSLDSSNDVGAPYILMSYINGTVAADLQVAKECAPGIYGTAEQDRKFRERMACIQVELSAFEFTQIGSLYQDDKTSDFFIGPEIETGKGPWTSSTDYYNAVADHRLQASLMDAEPDVRNRPSIVLPIVFKHLISSHQSGSKNGPFRLTNRDFGAHNLLVNDEFDIIGVIDFDGIMAAPVDVVAQYPNFTGLDPDAPGYVPTNQFQIDRVKILEPQLKEYRNLIEAAEAGRIGRTKVQATMANTMLSDGATLCLGLHKYAGQQDFINDRWMEAYLKFLHKQVQL